MFKRALFLATLTLLAASCGMIPSPGSDAESPVELDQAAPRSTQITEGQPRVRIQAEFVDNRVLFQIDNFYAEDGLLVAPESFAVGAHAQDVHYSRDEDVVTRFTAQVLPYGSSMAGEMIVTSVQSLENFRLIFFSTQTEPRMWDCEILPRRAGMPAPETEGAQIPPAP